MPKMTLGPRTQLHKILVDALEPQYPSRKDAEWYVDNSIWPYVDAALTAEAKRAVSAVVS